MMIKQNQFLLIQTQSETHINESYFNDVFESV